MPSLLIAKLRCFVAGTATDSVDFQVRYFDSNNLPAACSILENEKPQSYQNEMEEIVEWRLEDIVAAEVHESLKDSAEIVGFITGEPPKKA